MAYLTVPELVEEIERLETKNDELRSRFIALIKSVESAKYLIWSNEHKAWWKPNNLGYTVHLKDAGHYGREEALIICCGSGLALHGIPDEILVPVEDWDRCIKIDIARMKAMVAEAEKLKYR